MTLDWRGDDIKRKVARASLEATVETVDEAIPDAQAATPVDTGAARDSIRRDSVVQENGIVSVSWGYHVAYGIWIEIGARSKAGVHALRRAADQANPHLVGRLKRKLAA